MEDRAFEGIGRRDADRVIYRATVQSKHQRDRAARQSERPTWGYKVTRKAAGK